MKAMIFFIISCLFFVDKIYVNLARPLDVLSEERGQKISFSDRPLPLPEDTCWQIAAHPLQTCD